MEVLSSRVLLRPRDLARSRRFYAETLGLAVYREFGPADHPGTVFFLGQGFLELSGKSDDGAGQGVALWLQVRDVAAEEERLRRAGVTVLREAREEPWGLIESWIADPDGHRIVLVQVPPGHPLRRDPR
ncbi:VOC family protein [Nonomuraea sp. NPDC049480]|uniref:VOC family protein n=1 Tax=Nonomuraea sp. NPDC049480 TaxID=3364353 RepID=UPI0037B2A087